MMKYLLFVIHVYLVDLPLLIYHDSSHSPALGIIIETPSLILWSHIFIIFFPLYLMSSFALF